MAPLPLLKLFGLLVKTLSKPLAARMKTEAKRKAKFSSLCIFVGQQSHQITSRLTALASGFRVLTINPLAEEEALSQGISFLSEFFVFSVAGGIIIIEFARSELKNAQKAEQTVKAEAEFRQYLEDRFSNLDQKLESMARRIETIEQKQTKDNERNRRKDELKQASEQQSQAAEPAFNPQKESWVTWLWRRDS